MKPTDYLASLLPSFERSELLSDVRALKKELVEITLPPYESAAGIYAKWKFRHRDIVEFSKEFDHEVRTEFRGNFVEVLAKVLGRASENLSTIEDLIEKKFAKDVMREGLTYHKANILQYVESITFFSKFARKVLIWTHACETNMIEDRTDRLGKELTPAERDWLRMHRKSFFTITTILSGKEADLKKTIEEVPDIVINPENTQGVLATVGARKLDPYHFGLIPVKLNPIYHIGMAIAEWQVSRYNSAVEEKRLLEYRLMALEASKEGKKDANLQQQIEYTENRLQKLNFKIAKMEEDYA